MIGIDWCDFSRFFLYFLANLNILKFYKERNANFDTPLHVAADLGYEDVVSVLLSLGADITALDKMVLDSFLSSVISKIIPKKGSDAERPSCAQRPLGGEANSRFHDVWLTREPIDHICASLSLYFL